MGYDLTNSAGGYHQWKVLGWWHLLNLARSYGWNPAGTEPPAEATPLSPWDGNYFRNDGQFVTATDAAALADALERMLSDPKREDVAGQVARRLQWAIADESITSATELSDVITYPIEYVRGLIDPDDVSTVGCWEFDERSDAYLREFIHFARQGTFSIE